VSYKANEVNWIASAVAFILAQAVAIGMFDSSELKGGAFLVVTSLGAVLLYGSVPLLLMWFGAVLIKLFRLRSWSLFCLMMTATLLPLGGGIGTPIYGLFAIIVALYVTCFGWPEVEQALWFFKPRYNFGIIALVAIVLLMVRS